MLRKNFFQNVQGFWFFKSVQMKTVVINQYLQNDLSFDDMKYFLIVVEFQVDQFFEQIAFMLRERTDGMKRRKNTFVHFEKRHIYIRSVRIKTQIFCGFQ